MPRRQTYLNQARGEGVPILLVDGGDCFFPGPTIKAPSPAVRSSEVRKARQILGAYNAMGYQALAVGPADLQMGVEALKDLEKESRFPFLCANLVDKSTRRTLFRPWIVLEAGGLKVGVYAVILDTLHEALANRVLPDAEVLDPEQVTRDVVGELRGQCDLVLALSHLNSEVNEKILAAQLGIDILVDPLSINGSKSLWVDEGRYCTFENGSFVLRVDGQGSRVGVFELFLEGESKKPAGFRGYDVPLEPHFLRHPALEQSLLAFASSSRRLDDLDFDPSKPRLLDDYLGEEGCGGCHEEQRKFWSGTRHSTAFATLEKTGDHEAPDCFICHTYGYGVTFVRKEELQRFKDVQCESCHGLKPRHAENPRAARLGAVDNTVCYGCHNPEITQVPFVHGEVWDRVACPKMTR